LRQEEEEVAVVAPLEHLLLSEGPEEVVRALQSFYLEGAACLIAV
jgi:hypothetical protein